MGEFTAATRNAWLDDFTSTTKYLALFDGDPQAAGTEVTGGAYARVAITAADWGAATGDGTCANSALKSFVEASGDWISGADITYWGICTSGTATTDDVEASDTLTVAKPITNGDTASFAIGAVTLSIT